MLNKKILVGVLFVMMMGIFLPVLQTNAALPTLIPKECRGKQNLVKCESCPALQENRDKCCCDLGSVELAAITVAQIVIGITGSILLLMFVLGGILFTLSGGQQDKIKKATDIIKNSVIGLAIILLAGVAIRILLQVLSGVK
ncbi:hypothetical protein HN958_03755 [Candidatus Falkowbacteria bacterium]|jgi:hypothetical protein|nr:hypothetical protein [Candidatus Falkowbacteria bacterium]MBT7007593.1 hypothetical protein [Candidatus Falkowbacteria bacterium]